jgi:hypothetical protein
MGDSGITADYEAFKRLVGTNGQGGLQDVISGLQNIQGRHLDDLEFVLPGTKVSFPGADAFQNAYKTARDGVVNGKTGSMDVLLRQVQGLHNVAGWTVTNYAHAGDLQRDGAKKIKDQLDLNVPGMPGSL